MFSLDLTLIKEEILLAKADLIIEEQSYKWDTIDVKSVDNIDMIFILFKSFLACRFKTTGSSLEKQIYAKLCHYLKVFYNVIFKNGSGNWI